MTPGDSVTSCAKFRPFSGSSAICFCSILVATAADVVSTIGLSPVTVTVSWTCPTGSEKSTTVWLPTVSARSLRTTVWKPASAAWTVYVPRGRSGSVNRP